MPTMTYLQVVNWDKYQHYSKRRPPWIKLYAKLADNPSFICLQDASKIHLIMIWLYVSRSENIIPNDPLFMQRAIRSTEPIDLDRLTSLGFLETCVDVSNMLAKPLQTLSPLDQSTEIREERSDKTEKREKRPKKKAIDPNIELRFEEFWEAYPRKVSGDAARKAWLKIKPDEELHEKIMAGLTTATKLRQWEDSQFVPHASTWLNGKRWKDDNKEKVRAGSGIKDSHVCSSGDEDELPV